MSKKVSLEEKKSRLLEFFHEKKDVFLLKDIEKLAAKEKGIPYQSIKDIVNILVSDDLVETDKIGTSTYFWSFPSNTFLKRTKENENLEKFIEKHQEEIKKLDETIESACNENAADEGEEQHRKELEEKIIKLESEEQELLEKLKQYKDYDTSNLEELEQKCAEAREAIDRWTDNVFAIKSWCKKKFSMDESEINRALGLPTNFDYYED